MANIANIYMDANETEYKKHAVARVSLVNDDAHLFDLLDEANAIEQGANVVAGEQVGDEMQVRAVKTPAIGDEIVFVCDVPLIYKDGTKLDQAEWQYFNRKGKITKGYQIFRDNVLGVSDYAFSVLVEEGKTPAKGNYVVVDGKRGWAELPANTAETELNKYGFLAKVIGYEKYQFDTIVLFRVIRNKTV